MRRTANALRGAIGRALVAADFQPRGWAWWRRRGPVQQVVCLEVNAGVCVLRVGLAVDELWTQDRELVREVTGLDGTHLQLDAADVLPSLPSAWTLDEDTILPLRARGLADAARALAEELDEIDSRHAVQNAGWCSDVLHARLQHAAGDKPI